MRSIFLGLGFRWGWRVVGSGRLVGWGFKGRGNRERFYFREVGGGRRRDCL